MPLPIAAHTYLSETFGSGPNEFTLSFAEVGHPGNPDDPGTVGRFTANTGAVALTFYMGTFEISREQVFRANAGGALGISMYDYDANGIGVGNGDHRPASGVSWMEAARFVNYLNLSQGYSPAYKFAFQPGDADYDAVLNNILLWEPGDAGYDPDNLFRNTNAVYYLPTEDQWYKAAYYGGSGDTYYDFAYGSDTLPIQTGGGTDPGTAVFGRSRTAGPADVDQAGGLSLYGVVGLNGNVWEWTESASDGTNDHDDEYRDVRGGKWNSSSSGNDLGSNRSLSRPTNLQNQGVGFRVARALDSNAIPEPSRVSLIGLAITTLLLRRRREGLLLQAQNR